MREPEKLAIYTSYGNFYELQYFTTYINVAVNETYKSKAGVLSV